MKKIVKFICLLVVVALIAILIMKNGANAENDRLTISAPTEIKVGEEANIQINFGGNGGVTSYFGCKVFIQYTGEESSKKIDFGDKDGTDVIPSKTVTLPPDTFEKEGEVTIRVVIDSVTYQGNTVPDENVSGSTNTTIKSAEPEIPSFTLSIDKSEIKVNETAQVSVNGADVNVTYSSSDNAVASVNDSGMVTGIAAGTTTITATATSAEGLTKSASIDVTVIDSKPEQPEEITLTLNPTRFIKIGETTNAEVNPPTNGIVFSTDNDKIASVDSNGVVKGIAEGPAKITATAPDGRAATAELLVMSNNTPVQPDPPAETKTPTLSPSSIALEAYFKSTTITSDIPVKWKSSNNNIAAVESLSDTQAKIISNNVAGNCEIIATAKEGGKEAKAQVTVKLPEDNNTRTPILTPSKDFQLSEGETIEMTADMEVTWSSDNTSVATINANSGELSAKKAGVARITAKSKVNGKTASVAVTVNSVNNEGNGSNEGNEKFKLTPSKAQTIKVGGSVKLKANKAVASWQSSKPNVVAVDKNGVVKGIAAGTAYVSSIAIDGSVAQIKITVKEASSEEATGNPGTSNSSSEVEEDVPATGESTTEMLIILGVITLAIAAIIFRKKTK